MEISEYVKVKPPWQTHEAFELDVLLQFTKNESIMKNARIYKNIWYSVAYLQIGSIPTWVHYQFLEKRAVEVGTAFIELCYSSLFKHMF